MTAVAEGAQYYRHAGLCSYGAMTVLNTVTDGHFDTLFRWDKVKILHPIF